METWVKGSRRSIGNRGEDIACKYLINSWYLILARNYQIKWGEIDIIASDGRWTIMVEVRYRVSELHGHPLDTFGITKRRTLRRTAYFYTQKHGINPDSMRIDFIGIMPKKDGTRGYRLWHMEWVDVS